jgi:hypothetical protein
VVLAADGPWDCLTNEEVVGCSFCRQERDQFIYVGHDSEAASATKFCFARQKPPTESQMLGTSISCASFSFMFYSGILQCVVFPLFSLCACVVVCVRFACLWDGTLPNTNPF